MTEQLTFIDLCAGIGGFRLALESIGARCVYTCEKDKFARQTYAANFDTSGHPFATDPTQVDPATIPDHDILAAGFPCQPYSNAGLRQGFADHRGNIFFHIVEILRVKRPAAFILENVKGLVHHDNGNTMAVILRTLQEELGYTVHWRVLSSAPYVPQKRERVFFVGFREPTEFAWPEPPPSLGLCLGMFCR